MVFANLKTSRPALSALDTAVLLFSTADILDRSVVQQMASIPRDVWVICMMQPHLWCLAASEYRTSAAESRHRRVLHHLLETLPRGDALPAAKVSS